MYIETCIEHLKQCVTSSIMIAPRVEAGAVIVGTGAKSNGEAITSSGLVSRQYGPYILTLKLAHTKSWLHTHIHTAKRFTYKAVYFAEAKAKANR